MKNFEECKDAVAIKQGYKHWSHYVIAYQPGLGTTYEERLQEAAELYAKEKAKEAIRLAREKIGAGDLRRYEYSEQQIIDQLFKL